MPTAATDGLRVVFVTHNYPRHAGDVAGAFLHPLALALRDRGADVRVVAPSDHGAGGSAPLDGIPVRRVRYATPARERYAYSGTMADAVRTPGGLLALARLVAALRRAAREEARDAPAGRAVVHAHWWIPGGLAAPPEVPMVCTCHGTDVRLLARGGPARWLGVRTLRRARVVTTVSMPFAERLRTAGIAIPDDAIQPMPVPTVPRPRSTGGGGVVVLGRLTAQKRVDLAITAWRTARSRHGLVLPLTIIGDGPERPALERLAARGDGAPKFRGAVAPGDVPALLATADLVVMPARDEGLGLAAAEALMQGVPVVACTDGGGVRDVVPAAGGGRIADPTPDALAGAMMALVGDPAAREAAWQDGARWRERLAPGAVAERALGWYREALDA